MSRIIIKNLPSDIKEEKLRNLFGEKGTITDCSLKYTKEGVFRKFAFIGYRTPAEAEQAVKYFNKTFINTARIQVEKAKDLGDPTKPRAWSRYSEDSSLFIKSAESKTPSKQKPPKTSSNSSDGASKQKKNTDDADEINDDPEFQEFLALHKNRTLKPKWTDDAVVAGAKPVKENKKKKNELNSKSPESNTEDVDSDSESAYDDQDDDNTVAVEEKKTKSNPDLEYLKSKVKSIPELDDEADEKSKQLEAPEHKTEEKESGLKYLVRMRGLPTKITEKQLRDFFAPIELKACKLPHRGKKAGSSSNVTVEFLSAADLEQAMGRNKSFIGQKKVFLHKLVLGTADKSDTASDPAWKTKLAAAAAAGSNEDETIAESGRLYVRNLPYCCTEEDLESLFKAYGLLSEINMPIDKFTKKPKGFAFVTYVIPENAVKAFAELDRQSFQGRLLHILPGKVKDEEAADLDNMPFKQKKELLQKKKAASSHNWNTLFLGANAVADVVADKYGASKSHLLDPTSSESIGVKLALGETQVVAETRQFLVDHGIALDAFSQAAAPRSKTVLIVKNLPAKTTAQELSDMFSKHGTVSRLVLPPSGVTGVVEFTEPSEAKAAFTALAYTKFKHLPLYLEWGPSGTFTSPPPASNTAAPAEVPDRDTKDESRATEAGSDDDTQDDGNTLFVKNISFETSDESLSKFFAKCGKVVQASVARKKDPKKPGQLLSMGYGFVTFKSRDGAQKALKELQHASLDGHTLELKTSHRNTAAEEVGSRKKQDANKQQKSTKILVRNIPFEAKYREIKELFAAFGELRTVRLPKKVAGTGVHRGFGFIDFITHHDAKRAFNALCHSTHLYGRRLVLEWANTEESVDDLRQKTAEHFHEDGPKRKKQKVDVKASEGDVDV